MLEAESDVTELERRMQRDHAPEGHIVASRTGNASATAQLVMAAAATVPRATRHDASTDYFGGVYTAFQSFLTLISDQPRAPASSRPRSSLPM